MWVYLTLFLLALFIRLFCWTDWPLLYRVKPNEATDGCSRMGDWWEREICPAKVHLVTLVWVCKKARMSEERRKAEEKWEMAVEKEGERERERKSGGGGGGGGRRQRLSIVLPQVIDSAISGRGRRRRGECDFCFSKR